MRIMVAIDFGLFGEAQVEFLRNCKIADGSRMKVIHVIEPLSWELQPIYPAVMTISDELMKERREAGERLIKDVVKALQTFTPEEVIEMELREGNPVDEILTAADEWNADVIMVGSHGRRGFERLLLGSVSSALSSHAKCSVVIARNG